MIDPILTEIVRNWLATAADEMSVALVRSAYSTTAKESQDATTALFDEHGRMIAQSSGTNLLQSCSLRECLQALLEDYPPSAMHPGDTYAMNDPYRGGIHSNDIGLISPVFVDGSVAYFSGALMHVADLGGIAAGGLPPQATDVFQEGLLLPPLPLVQGGRFNDVIGRIIVLNTRTPAKVLGDIAAMLAATQVGGRRLLELVDRHSDDVVRRIIAELFDYTERRTRDAIEALPNGQMSGAFAIDDDGIHEGVHLTVRVTVERNGSDLRIDFEGTDPQAAGPINAAYSQSLSGIVYGIRCFMDPSIPMNEGFFRPIEIVLPYGTLVNPAHPAALNARVVTVTAAIEAIIDAMSAGDRAQIAASAINHVLTVAGRTADGSAWLFYDSDFGGVGARNGKDGLDASGAYFFRGRSHVIQVEAFEAEYPVLYERYALIPDSGGPGRWRGGLGVERVLRVLEDAEIGVRGDRMQLPPPGREGGAPGLGGTWSVEVAAGRIDLPTKKMGVRLRAGETVTMRTSGGGGFGPPEERDRDLVARDVLEGKVSRGAASAIYGVHLTDQGAVDVDRMASSSRRRTRS